MKFFNTLLLLFVFTICGCDAAYLPWNAGTRWDVGSTDSTDALFVSSSNVLVEEIDLENYCEDNREFIERCRTYVQPEYDWHRPRSSMTHRILYIQNLIDQYDNVCASQ
jgi:hypothetical protein